MRYVRGKKNESQLLTWKKIYTCTYFLDLKHLPTLRFQMRAVPQIRAVGWENSQILIIAAINLHGIHSTKYERRGKEIPTF